MIKSLIKADIEMYILYMLAYILTVIKTIYGKPMTSIILSDDIESLLLKPETRKGCPLLLLFNIVYEVLAIVIRQEKIKRHPNWKGKK